MKLKINEFLKKYHISEDEFAQSGYSWEELMMIYDSYVDEMKDFKILAQFIEECMGDIKRVHSIKIRIKEPNHLIRKIIRRKLEKGDNINLDNYKELITDIIGIRVLHLFKEDWLLIHNNIYAKWIMKEIPVANIRDGDSQEFIDQFKAHGLEINKHQYGYRSVHYQILLVQNKKEITAEIQVRTLFEEVWSEIDHRIRYPYNFNDPILAEYLVIFNRLAGSADEMGSFIMKLKKDLDVKNNELADSENMVNKIINEINTSSLPSLEKENLINTINRLNNYSKTETDASGVMASSFPQVNIIKKNDAEASSPSIDDSARNLEELMQLEKDMGMHS